MQPFAYANPTKLAEAVALLGNEWGETEILAGGTDLLALMKDNVAAPKRLVNIKNVAEIRGIRVEKGTFRIGASVTLEILLAHPLLGKAYTGLAEAARGVASPQIRNMGTVGGDLLQRPRCWYYRAGFGLLAHDDKGQPLVPHGDNRYHAIFGNDGPAYFVSPSSLAPALIALGAKLQLHGPSGAREVSAEDFFVIPKSENEREHAIKPNEILSEIIIPPPAAGSRSATYEVREKEALDWPLATASVALRMDGARIAEAHVVLGHAAPIPWRARRAEKSLEGKSLDDASAAAAGDAAVTGAKPLSRNGYKVQLARVAVKRALLACAEQPRAAAAKEGA
jgi:xanthine dehydrogenase YagS FAD-binding subunit